MSPIELFLFEIRKTDSFEVQVSVDVYAQMERFARRMGNFEFAFAAQEMAKAFARDGRLHTPPFRGIVELEQGI